MKNNNLFFLFLLIPFLGMANNIQVQNVTLASQNTVDDFYMIEFDLTWENSWRTSSYESNWDAAWVFVKFTPKSQHQWSHGNLHYVNGTNDGHLAPTGCTIRTAQNPGDGSIGKGVFVYRSGNGIGNISFTGIQLRWDYGSNGVGDNDVVEISVHAIEMVYVSPGAFYVGDGMGDNGQFEAGNTGLPFLINSEGAINLGGVTSSRLSNNNAGVMLNPDDFNYLTLKTLPAAFPKGYKAFYCMKYEASQAQYAAFLALLTPTQRNSRGGPHLDNMVDVFPNQHGNHYAYADYPARPMHYIGWPDMAAYLDWSGLRPMSELEYEKACRGPINPILNEYAWGNNSWYNETYYTLIDEGTEAETISEGIGQHTGNANSPGFYTGLGSPIRCGIFAASAQNKTRQETGATYWGIMEMTGNCYEFTLSVGNALTRDFTGLHGDGYIETDGSASLTLLVDWAINNADGVGYRSLEISNRYYANYDNENRELWHGIRGVRTAPH